ncbi:MAG: site-2 protease family protein [Acutalibacteraceae bacterium]|nr:site-2 protease family protein [Acutalibacteraceae bacterium]
MKLRIAGTFLEINFRFAAVITVLLTVIPQSNAFDCFVLCLLHEIGHLGVMLISGRRIQGIRFDYFGIKIISDRKFLTPFREAAIAAGGPCVNFVFASVLFICGKESTAVLSLALAFFNLLPVSILDGGHILSALFPDSKAVRFISSGCAVLLLIAGIAVAIYSKKNFTLLTVSLYLLIGTVCKKD